MFGQQMQSEEPRASCCACMWPSTEQPEVTTSNCKKEKQGKSWRNIATALAHSTRLGKADSKDNIISLDDFVEWMS